MLSRRDAGDKSKQSVHCDAIKATVEQRLQEIQDHLYQSALERQQDSTLEVTSKEAFTQAFDVKDNTPTPFVICYAQDSAAVEAAIKPLKVSARCIPLDQEETDGTCIFTGETVNKRTIFARAY